MKTSISLNHRQLLPKAGWLVIAAALFTIDSVPIRADLVAHWAFDEAGGTVANDSVGGLNGTLSPSGASFVAGGISSNAVSISRATNGFVNMGNVLSLTSGDFSIVAWVKMSPGDATLDTMVLAKHETSSVNGYFLLVNQSGGGGLNNKATFYAGGLVSDGAVSTSSVNDGSWHQVVGVYKSGVNKVVYVDGVPQGTNSVPLINANTGAFLIGGLNQSGVPTGFFTGLVDDVQVYNHALGSSDILYLFQNPGNVVSAPPPSVAPLAHWTFDETGGTVAHDSAGGLDGTLSPNGAGFVSGGISSNAVSISRATNGFVNMGNVLSLTSGSFSIVAWVKLSPGDISPDTMILAKHETGSVNGYFLGVNQSGGGGQNNKASFYAGGLAADGPVSTTSVNDGNWHQVVGVYKSGVSKVIYVDGLAEDTNSAPAVNGNTAPFLIGGLSQSGVPTSFFTGLVDDVQVYGYALGPNDIHYLFQNPGNVLPAPPSPCATPPSGLVGWWKGETNALDQSGANHGTILGNTSFAIGRVGQGFVFDGNEDGIPVGNPTNLQLQNFTIEAWIKRTSTAYVSSGPGLDSVFFSYGSGGYGFGLDRNGGRPVLSMIDVSSVTPAANVTVADTNFHHLAVTKSGANVVFYIDGVAYPAPAYPVTFSFTTPAAVGATGDGLRASFYGAVDELAVYDRALSAAELQAVYNAGNTGKCTGATPPFVFSQPTNQTVVTGETATFSVLTGGTLPLSYQWRFNGTNINGATGSSLVLTNAQFADAGTYSVIISNLAGITISSNALLAVNPTPVCTAPPSGLVGWWKGEVNALDQSGVNNGTILGNATFGAGRIGQGFLFDGNGDGVVVGNPPSLQLQDFTIEAWIKRASTAYVSSGPGLDSVFFSYGSGGYGFGLDRNGGRPVLSQIDVNSVTPTANVTVADTNYHHLAVTKSGASVVFYIDGMAYPAPAYDSTFSFTTLAAIGATGDGLRASFFGAVDELAVYNLALAASEIQAIYNAGGSGKCLSTNPPSILSQPTNQIVAEGGTAIFNVVAAGTQPLRYQWTFGGSPLTDATNASLTLTAVTTNQAGAYAVQVTNLYGSVSSSNANLTVRVLGTNLFDDFEPGIDLLQWSSFGGAVLATNYGGFVSPSNSLWFGGTGSRYAVTRPLNTSQGASIQFYLRIANGTSYPWEKADLPGDGIVLEYSTSGGGNWVQVARYDTSAYFNWTNISAVVPIGAQAANTQFRWRQLSNSGALNDHWALDDVLIATGPVAPTILAQPQNQTVAVGGTATFNVTVSGTQPLNYQWQFGGTNIDGATSSPLVLTNVQFTGAGTYSVVVSNVAGIATSSNAVLTVNPPSPCATAPSGLVGWWRGEGDALDQSGTNNGTILGNTAFGVGQVGQGFVFDANADGVVVGNAPSLQLQNFTIEAWIKRASTAYVSSGPGLDSVFFSYGSGGYGFGLDRNGGRPVLSRIDVNSVTPTANVTVADTNYHHLAVTKAGASVVFYIDGVAYPATAYASTFSFTTQAAIGATGDGLRAGFYGSVDELSVYNRALSATELQAIYNAGSAGKCVVATAPFITSQPSNQTVTVGANVTFTVTAGGTAPLSYQWSFNGTNINGATGSSVALTNVQFANAGVYSVVVSNSAGITSSSNAMLTVNFPPAAIQVVNSTGAAGGLAAVPIVLLANGNENALGFSLNFDPAVLTYANISPGSNAIGAALLVNTNQAGSGKLGVALALPAEGTFSAGTQQVIQIGFTVAIVTNATSTTISFGDIPIGRQLSDAPGNTLPATYGSGSVQIPAVAFEGDLSPRPNGNQDVTITDWVLAGRYAARLDYPTNTSEYQRADCAPRDTLGNGAITVTDWVQTGRYAARLDPFTPVGGPTSDAPGAGLAPGGRGPRGIRQLQIVDALLVQNQVGNVRVNLTAIGDENALGFSLTFDPSASTFASATLGSGATGATLNVNTNQIGSGKLGLVLALPTGATFGAGTKELVRVSMRASGSASGSYSVAFTNQPVPGEISDSAAQTLSVGYVNGTLAINPPPLLTISKVNQEITLSWPLWASNFALQTTENTFPLATWTNVSGTFGISNAEHFITLPISGSMKFYRLSSP